MKSADPIDRIFNTIYISEFEYNGTPCWISINTTDNNGYSRLSINGYRGIGHRLAYEYLIGPIPDDKEIDHLCKNRPCMNPVHMELVTHKENNSRGSSPTALNEKKTFCNSGHEFNTKNTYYRKDGGRDCKECHRIREIKRYHTNK